MRAAIRTALVRRAAFHFGPDADPLLYVVVFLGSGGTVAGLAASLKREIGWGCSRSFVSRVIHRLAPGAKVEIASARLGGPAYLAKLGTSPIDTDDFGFMRRADEIETANGKTAPTTRRGRATATNENAEEITFAEMHLAALLRTAHRAESRREHVTAGG